MPNIFAHFWQIWISSTDFQKSAQYQISQESGQCSNADICRQPNMMKLTGNFHNYVAMSKNDTPAVFSHRHSTSLLKDNINPPPKEIIYFFCTSEEQITVLEGYLKDW